ncbi:RDD family protein [Panacibacter sp. DH6]|uniref:RDD family protein n=1 Tax=Panacibacter microcysteis TaxID=2793269 RepID=A0A931GZ13_9BACT|nr:RDD family protein [Panacibacter microcysteis]MBG9377974.1 RDD family protein [Panacibacter microcysteis]
MAIISITTTQNIELEYELASLGDRIIASIVDDIIKIAYVVILLMVLGISADSFGEGGIVFFLLLMLPAALYSLLSEVFLNGQSVGKKVMAIKVISLNGNQPTFSQYLIRWIFRLIDLLMFSGLIAVVVVAATKKHQRIGDLVAGTTLVKTKARTGIEQTLYVPTVDTSYIVTYPEVVNLKDSDMQLIKEVMINVRKSGNNILAWQTTEKLENILHVKNQYDDPMNFLYVLLSDYNHLASKEQQ